MAVSVSNLIMGPGTLYRGLLGAVEPLDTAIANVPDSAIWTDLGGTNDGVTLTINQDFEELEVDQVTDAVGRVRTSRSFEISTNLAELTLSNLALTQNELSAVTTGAATSKYVPTNNIAASQPTYFALLFDGLAPNGKKRRIIARRVLSTDNTEFAYQKDEQAVYSVTFSAHYVSPTLAPFEITDQIT